MLLPNPNLQNGLWRSVMTTVLLLTLVEAPRLGVVSRQRCDSLAHLVDLDMAPESSGNVAKLYLLERLEFSGGRVALAVVVQHWRNEGGTWRVVDTSIILEAPGA